MADTNFDIEIATPYAEAFFNSILELYIKENYNNQIFFETLLDIEYILKLLNYSVTIENCLLETSISNIEKIAVLETCFSERTSKNSITKEFLIYLVNKKRIDSIQIILPIFKNTMQSKTTSTYSTLFILLHVTHQGNQTKHWTLNNPKNLNKYESYKYKTSQTCCCVCQQLSV